MKQWQYIRKIRLRNIRGFKDLTIDLTNPDDSTKMRLVMIGKNSTCKTSLLRCIVLGLCDREDCNALLAEPTGMLIGQFDDEAIISIWIGPKSKEKPKSYKTVLHKKHLEDFREVVKWKSPNTNIFNLFLCGYGVLRGIEGYDMLRPFRIIDSSYTLFSDGATLIGAELILSRLKNTYPDPDPKVKESKVYLSILKKIKSAIGLVPEDEIITPPEGGVFVEGPTTDNKRIQFEGLADGYRKTLIWILDFYGWALNAGSIDKKGNIKGVVVIDEIEQHLHPSLQAKLLPKLLEILPEVQIIATTHTPLIALNTEPGELVHLKKTGKTIYKTELPDLTGFTVNDILKHEDTFFTPVYSNETIVLKSEYECLLDIPVKKRTNKNINRIRYIANKLRDKGIRAPLISSFLEKLTKKLDL